MQKKIQNLLEMTNASIQLMSDMTGVCVVCVCVIQRWKSYFLKVTRYLLLLPAAKNISLQLHIT